MKLIVIYLTIVLTTLLLFCGIHYYGLHAFEEIAVQANQSSTFRIGALGDMLLALSVIIVVSRFFGFLFKKIGQPAVMGEVIGGIFLGPSLLKSITPEVMNFLIPQSTLPHLNIIAHIGIIFYMFIVGLELDLKELKKSANETLIISHTSILIPFSLGSVLALFIYKNTAPENTNFTNFMLFLGISMSITAFPVLARILVDRNISKTSVGSLALACAAIDDVTAWCLLAFVVSIAQANPYQAMLTCLFSLIYILFIFYVIKPVLEKWTSSLDNEKKFPIEKVGIILLGVLLSSLITESIGIHALFGAFLLGLVIPSESFVAKSLEYKFESIVKIMLLPTFFAYTGMKINIGLMNTLSDWILCLIIILVAIIGKFGGTFFIARMLNNSWRDSAILGVLMNTRGLVELIVLNIGLELGIISAKLFAMLVVMALVTTFMTGPLLGLLVKKRISS